MEFFDIFDLKVICNDKREIYWCYFVVGDIYKIICENIKKYMVIIKFI